ELRSGRADDAVADADRLAAAAAGRHVYGSPARPIRARDRDGVFAGRSADPVGGVDVFDAAGRGGPDGDRVVDFPPRIVACRANGVGRTARTGAVVVSGRRQRRLVVRTPAGGIPGRAARAAEHRMVFAAGA